MENKSFTVKECIRAAELDCVKAGKCVRHEDEQTLYLSSIAESLLAIAKIMNDSNKTVTLEMNHG